VKTEKITAVEFIRLTGNNSSWAAELDSPLEVCEFVKADFTLLTHLSPHLHFTGLNSAGWSASFDGCRHLTRAEGKFLGAASFMESGITEIGDLEVEMEGQRNLSCTFFACRQLKEASGKYGGRVFFGESAVTSIGKLECQLAIFEKCRIERIKGPLCVPNPMSNLQGVPAHLIRQHLDEGLIRKLRPRPTKEEMTI
jgi:hypothetical protein